MHRFFDGRRESCSRSMFKSVRRTQYTPGYRREPEEFCFPTMPTNACPSKMGRILKDVIPHCVSKAANAPSSNVWMMR